MANPQDSKNWKQRLYEFFVNSMIFKVLVGSVAFLLTAILASAAVGAGWALAIGAVAALAAAVAPTIVKKVVERVRGRRREGDRANGVRDDDRKPGTMGRGNTPTKGVGKPVMGRGTELGNGGREEQGAGGGGGRQQPVSTGERCKTIFEAIEKRNIKEIQRLVGEGADVNKPNEERYTPLMLAAKLGYADVAETLIRLGAEVDIGVKSFFTENPTEYHIRGTALIIAAMEGQGQIVDLLIKNKANVNVCEGRNGYTPLIAAIEKGHVNVVRLLATAGANVNYLDRGDGETLLMKAVRRDNTEMVKVLLDSKADIRAETRNMGYRVGVLTFVQSKKMEDFLIEKGADTSVCTCIPQVHVTAGMSR